MKEQGQILRELAEELKARIPQFPLKILKNKLISGRHRHLTDIGVPRGVNGQKLGLRKREIIANGLRVH